MSDLIERKKAIEAMGKAQWAKERLMELPSAQPEIIRCKDCKYRGGLSGFYCDIVEKMVGVDSFCSFAERRTDAD